MTFLNPAAAVVTGAATPEVAPRLHLGWQLVVILLAGGELPRVDLVHAVCAGADLAPRSVERLIHEGVRAGRLQTRLEQQRRAGRLRRVVIVDMADDDSEGA